MTHRAGTKKDTAALTLAPNYQIYGAFGLGLVTAVAFRAIIVLDQLHPAWVRPVWYFAVVGNFLFFYYRYQIARKRKHAVVAHQLVDKIRTGSPLAPGDREVLQYLLTSIQRSPENINYLVIFLFSLIAIAVDLFLVVAARI